MSARFGVARVRRSVLHFLIGKSISSLAGFAALVLVVRGLAVAEFADYSALLGLVDLLAALSSLGLAHAVLRFVPELYSKHYHVALRRFVISTLLARSLLLIVFLLTISVMSNRVANWIGLVGTAEAAFLAFLVVVLLRSTNHFISQILDSTLSQGFSQIGFTTSAVIRLAGMYFLLVTGNTRLVDVIWMEAMSDASGLLVLLAGVIRIVYQKGETDAPADDATWTASHFGRITRFAAKGYLQHLLMLPFGGNTNRLLGGHFLSPPAMAGFGFSQSLADYVSRYLPAQMLLNVIRPVILSRYATTGDFSAAARLANLNFKINAVLIGSIIALLPVAGEGLIKFVSGGKYGWESAMILLALMFVLLLDTLRQQLDVMVQAVERYEILIVANILLSLSLLITVVSVPAFGALAFPVISILGLSLTNNLVVRQLKARGFVYLMDWQGTARIATIITVAAAVGYAARLASGDWRVGGVVVMFAYATALLTLGRSDVNQFLALLASARARPLASSPAAI